MKRIISVWVHVLCVSVMIKAEIYKVRKRAEDYRDAVILDDVTGVTGHIAESSIDAQ